MTPELQALTDQVTASTTIEAGAVTLLDGLAAQILTMKNDPAALTALAGSLKTSSDTLAADILANTPGGPVVAARRRS